jgi:hypothetical protein
MQFQLTWHDQPAMSFASWDEVEEMKSCLILLPPVGPLQTDLADLEVKDFVYVAIKHNTKNL